MVKLDKSEMLSKFFHAQWDNSIQSDWVLNVRENLLEIDLPDRLEDIQTISTYQFKTLVKKRAKEFEFQRLLELKMKNQK